MELKLNFDIVPDFVFADLDEVDFASVAHRNGNAWLVALARPNPTTNRTELTFLAATSARASACLLAAYHAIEFVATVKPEDGELPEGCCLTVINAALAMSHATIMIADARSASRSGGDAALQSAIKFHDECSILNQQSTQETFQSALAALAPAEDRIKDFVRLECPAEPPQDSGATPTMQ